ncbi:MAG: type II toxin-antitoxin system VapB family antitoxin [Acidobacteria bacterium]|nr:type II toxin-antitoxin system VapB family antitoxin [Acidobacteriota bacterium]
MRTKVVLKDELVERARALSDARTLSGLLNRCLADWIADGRQREIEARLRKEYTLGAPESAKVNREFADIDSGGWPGQ